MRENLAEPGDLLLRCFFNTGKFKKKVMPPGIRQHIIEQETDTLVLLKKKGKNPFIFIWSSRLQMITRRLQGWLHTIYDSLKLWYGGVRVVIYTGERPMKMKNPVRFNGNHLAAG